MKRIDLTNKVFGHIKVLYPTNKRTNQDKIIWHCICENCKNEFDICGDNLKYKHKTHCGCLGRKGKGAGKPSKRKPYIHKNGYYIGFTTNTNKEFYIDEDDFELIKNFSWYENDAGYAISRINNKNIRMHRFIFNLTDNEIVDHKNHNTLDNRKNNIRICTKKENNMNKKAKGVIFTRGKYYAYITKNYHRINLGYYDTQEVAIKARKEAEEKYFGEYSYDNSMKTGEIKK